MVSCRLDCFMRQSISLFRSCMTYSDRGRLIKCSDSDSPFLKAYCWSARITRTALQVVSSENLICRNSRNQKETHQAVGKYETVTIVELANCFRGLGDRSECIQMAPIFWTTNNGNLSRRPTRIMRMTMYHNVSMNVYN